jgi:hypothetical protein
MDKFILKQDATFESLTKSIIFEDIAAGRKGANLCNPIQSLVRTTTLYANPTQQFLPIHYSLMSKIHGYEFNNALIEIYTNKYRSMGFHSDQELDLDENSYIYIYMYIFVL